MNDDTTVLVCVRHQGAWLWFQSPVEFWILDQRKWVEGFRRHGHDVPEDYQDRFDMPVVDRDEADDFLALMAQFGRDRDDLEAELRGLAEPAESWWDVAPLMPVFLVDFDTRTAHSLFGEGVALENYVPAGWTGTFGNFYPLIPDSERYWVVDGVDQVERFKTRT